jgi:hypothetical protein
MKCHYCREDRPKDDFKIYLESVKTDGLILFKKDERRYKKTGQVCDKCRTPTRLDAFFQESLGEPFDMETRIK